MRKWKLAALILLPLLQGMMGSCSKGSDDGEPTPSNGSDSLKMLIVASCPNMACELIEASQDGNEVNTRFSAKWGDKPTSEVWAKQNDKLVYLGKQSISFTSSEKDKGAINIDGTGKIDAGKPYEIIGLSCSWRRDGDELFYRTDLHRSGSFGTYFKTVGGKWFIEASSRVAGTVEILYVINKTDKPVKFRHKGFDVENKWYYTHAEVSIDKGTVVNTEQNGDAIGEEGEMPVFTGKNALKVYSFYVPNGNKIQDAQLIAEIDGKEVRSVNRISSDITLQTDHTYGIFAVWDGEKLTLGDSKGNGVIELPEGTPININNITIVGDGAEVQLNSDGTFESKDNSIVAFGRDDNIIYMSYASVENNKKHEVVLNSTETAITLLLPSIPGFMEVDTDETLNKLKNMVGELTETKMLANSIDESVKRNGYFDINDIADTYQMGHKKILDLLGIGNEANSPAMSMNRAATRASQYEPTIKPSISDYNPMDLNVLMSFHLKKSTWKKYEGDFNPDGGPGGGGGTAYSKTRNGASNIYGWNCEFDITNARLATMVVIRGWKTDGPGVNYSTDPEYLFKNIIPAATTKNTIDRITTWDGYKEKLKLLSLSWEDGHFHGIDEGLKEEAKLDFFFPTDGIMAIGPADLTEVFLYNLLSCAVDPLIKSIGSKFSSGGESKSSAEGKKTSEERRQKFLTDLMIELIKAKTITKITVIMESDKTMNSKIEDTMGVIWPVLKKQLIKQFDKDLQTLTKDVIFEITSEQVNIKELDKFFKEETKWIKICSTAIDAASGLWLGSQETGVFVRMLLDFGDPSGTIDIIPGFKI